MIHDDSVNVLCGNGAISVMHCRLCLQMGCMNLNRCICYLLPSGLGIISKLQFVLFYNSCILTALHSCLLWLKVLFQVNLVLYKHGCVRSLSAHHHTRILIPHHTHIVCASQHTNTVHVFNGSPGIGITAVTLLMYVRWTKMTWFKDCWNSCCFREAAYNLMMFACGRFHLEELIYFSLQTH